MKKRSNLQFAKALYEVTKSAPEEKIPEIIKEFFIVLQKNNKLKKIDYIVEEFKKYSKKQSGIKTIEIESAQPITDLTREKIKKVFGEKSEISEKVNKKILGGARITVDDMIYDGSLVAQLQKLKQLIS